MDMLLCGDVGYGKTEVVMKAAFRAVYDGKQVAVVAPTTLLTEQHFRTFRARFSGFPVSIDYISRFKSKKDIDRTLKALSAGEIDIIIGTHILFNKKVSFHDLELLIIDEEHRFGVSQKERLKDLKKGVDTLTLTATPIPRTLQMSLSGIMEMCVIETPPDERLAVRSAVAVFNDAIIKEAVARELKRGGQVFFVHNRILDIYKIADYIKKLAPDAIVSVAHGQMKESELERTMLGFLNREADILVCTAIIGAGLDITTANAIIINRADTFGLSDLYQLRGRVGRGNIQAYAYFLMPGEDIITDDAKKRLNAIQEMSYLGAGFRLALKDLEIRGAGNLLGPEQSGHIYRVGFDMYMEMLEKAVAGLKGEEIREEFDPQIRLRLSAIIPEEYIPDITLRLSFYRRISSVKSMQELSELKDEIADRFGSMPDEVKNLLNVVQVKILARQLYISKVFQLNGKYRFSFLSDAEKKYRVPEGFFDRLLKALVALQKRDKGIRFLPDGFEMDTKEMPSEDSIIKAASTLQAVWTRLSK
jgi:transcription-repair coupling factor (superfamily II helicase)